MIRTVILYRAGRLTWRVLEVQVNYSITILGGIPLSVHISRTVNDSLQRLTHVKVVLAFLVASLRCEQSDHTILTR